MAHAEPISTLRRKRSTLFRRFDVTKYLLDGYEKKGQVDMDYLISVRKCFHENWKMIIAVQEELEALDEEEADHAVSLLQRYNELDTRFLYLFEQQPSTPPTPSCSGSLANNFQGSHDDLNKTSNAIQTPPTEKITSIRKPISSHDMRSSSHETPNVSPTRDPTTTSSTSSIEQQSESTPSNALSQTIAQDSLDQQKDETLPDDMPSPTTLAPKWTTSASDLKQNTTPVDSMAAHKRPPSDLSDTSLITINFLESMIDQYEKSKREGQGKAQYFQGSDGSETQYKEGGNFSMSRHETVDDTWNSTNSVQEELEVLDKEESDHPETTSDAHLAVDTRFMELIGDGHSPLEASKTIATEDSDGSTRCNVTLIERGSKIPNKTTQFGQIIGGSSISKSALKLRGVLEESVSSTTKVLSNGTSWVEALPDTSWDEMSHDTSRTEVTHDNSCIVNLNWKCLGKNEVDVESKPMAKASTSTLIKQSRGSSSSDNTSTMNVQDNVSTFNDISYITSPVPPEIRNSASDSHSPRHNVKTPTSPPQRGATPAIGPNQNNFCIITTMTNHPNGHGNVYNIPSDLNDSLPSSQSATPNKSRAPDFSQKSPLAATTPHYSPMVNQAPITTPNASYLPRIITKRMRFGQSIGGSSVSQSAVKLRAVFDESSPSITDVPFNDTSWDEVFHDTSWAERFHDTSWFVNFKGKYLGNAEDHGGPERKEDNISSTYRPFDRIVEVTLATTTSSRLSQLIWQRASWTEAPHSSSYYRVKLQKNTDNPQSTKSWAAAPINHLYRI